jgi:hypothetical protein
VKICKYKIVFNKLIAKTIIYLFVHAPRNIKQTITTMITRTPLLLNHNQHSSLTCLIDAKTGKVMITAWKHRFPSVSYQYILVLLIHPSNIRNHGLYSYTSVYFRTLHKYSCDLHLYDTTVHSITLPSFHQYIFWVYNFPWRRNTEYK